MSTSASPRAGSELLSPSEPDRVEKTLSMLDRSGLGLEIGASHQPMAPKSQGFDVHVVDHVSTEGLREKYRDDPNVEIDNIEEVDFVWSGEPLPELVGGTRRYDWVIASHVLEHLPDPVSFLRGCEQVLRPGGVVSLVLPDKRCCFDYFRPLSSTGDILNAFHNRRVRPDPGDVFDHFVGCVARGANIAWEVDDARPLAPVHTFGEARRLWERAGSGDDYIDVHIWRFVPESFRLIMFDLLELGLTGLQIQREYPTTGCEFHVSMRADVPPARPGPRERFSLVGLHDRMLEPVVPPAVAAPAAATVLTGITMVVSDRERRALAAKRRVMETLRRLAVGRRQ